MSNLEHLAKFRPNDLAIKEFEHWIVCVRAKQVTLGSCVLLLKRAEPSIPNLIDAEALGLVEAAAWFEAAVREAFGAEKFNYIAAMMKDPFVHFHAFPRYSTERNALGKKWADPYWPRAVNLDDVSTSESDLASLVNILKS